MNAAILRAVFLRKHFPSALMGMVVLSWALFPWAVAWIWPVATRALFSSAILIVLYGLTLRELN